jgi:hypothetical protein
MPSNDPAGRQDRLSLPGKDGPPPSNDLDRGTKLDRPGVPLGSGGGGGGNMGVDTSLSGKLNENANKEKAKFGEIRIPEGRDVPRSKR